MTRAVQLAIAAVIGGAAAVERKGALQLMLSRPLALGPLLGAALGDVRGGLTIGVPLELLFLGAVNLGATLPDNETIAASCAVAAAVLAGQDTHIGVDETTATLAIALFLPTAVLGRRLERLTEGINRRLAARARATIAAQPARAIRLHLGGLLAPFLAGAAYTGIAAALAPFLAALRRGLDHHLVQGLEIGWIFFLAVCCASAVRAIRDARAPSFAAMASGAIALVTLAVKILHWRSP